MKEKRDVILDTALTLFSADGYHSVGVDLIKEQAGVSKTTLYKHFPTKEALIVGVLLKRDELFRNHLMLSIAEKQDCISQIKAIFDWHDQWFRRGEFHGCMFIKASEEFPDNRSNIRCVSKQHKNYIKEMLEEILKASNVKDAELLAAHLLIVLEGMIVNANMFSDRSCVDSSWYFISELLKSRTG